MTKTTFCATVLIAAITIPVCLSVGSAPSDAKHDATAKPVASENPDVGKPSRTSVTVSDEAPGDKTVRLTFTINNDDGPHPFPVTCAARNFHLEHDITEADGGHQMKFTGYMKSVDQRDKTFVRFEIEQYHSNDTEGVDATFRLQGSAILTLGKKIDIGTLGEDRVSLQADIVE